MSKHDQIAGSLIEDILSGRYRPTERLPSERDLSARFDANRGAVREAMKKLEQIGLAEVQPGGARVKQAEEATLDVLGPMLAQGNVPDAQLLDQIMLVISQLMSLAAQQTLEVATQEELDHIRSLVRPIVEEDLDREQHTLARFELMQTIMLRSNNLPLQIIARSLFEQVAPHTAPLHPHIAVDQEAYRIFGRQLDTALRERDQSALRATFTEFSDLNRRSMVRAIDAMHTQDQEAKTS